MGIQDRDWYREEQSRKAALYAGDDGKPKRRLRWPYRLRPDLPYWAKEWIRAALFFGALGLLYLAWTQFRR